MPGSRLTRIPDERLLSRIYYFLVPNGRRPLTRRLRKRARKTRPVAQKPPSYRNFLAEFRASLSHLNDKSWVKITCGSLRSFQGLLEHRHVRELRKWMRGSPEFEVEIPLGTETRLIQCEYIAWHVTTNPVEVYMKTEHCEQDIEEFLGKLHDALSKE